MNNLVRRLSRQGHGSGRLSRRKFLYLLAIKITFIAPLAQTAGVDAAEVKVVSGAAMRGAFRELLPQFERATGHKIVIEYGAGTALRKQIEGGEAFDLVIIDASEVDELIKQGKIAGDTRADIVRAAIGVGVREGAPKPDISSVDAVKNTLFSVNSFTYAPDALYGRQLSQAFDSLGIGEQLKAKTKPNPLARVAPALAAGEVELAIAGIPTLLSVKGVQIVGVLPGELQSWFVNTGGVSAAAKEPDAAKALIKYLATPEAAAVIRAKGMEVPLSR
jgi:molybdate transport system substrate-binding protein